MNRCKNKKGFTLAELMLAVAIIIILGALAMVGVTRYLRGLRLLEMDNAAKEVFYAAQNRITAELNSGTLGRLDATQMKTDADNAKNISSVEYMVKYSSTTGYTNPSLDSTLWDEMLPFGSIDDTLRLGGSYIITYSLDLDVNMATVLDVWFASDEGTGIGRNWNNSEATLLGADYGDLDKARGDSNDAKKYRRNFPNGGNAVIGHYGSAGVSLSRSELAIKEFQLINKEELYLTGTVEIKGTITLDQVNVSIIVEGRESHAKKIVKLTPVTNAENATEGYDTNSGKFLFVLDDITTSNKRFSKQFATGQDDKKFIPGEDIQVTVEVYSNAVLANIDRATAVDNSLFQYVKQSTDETTAEAGIDNFRHLQNLSSEVSGVELGIKDSTDKTRMGINSAQQTANLVWKKVNSTASKGFVDFERPVLSGTGTGTPIGGDIYYNDSSKTSRSFYHINLKAANDVIPEKSSFMTYRAKPQGSTSAETHKIINLVIEDAHAGLFGTVENGGVSLAEKKHLLTVQNLIMENANITGTTTAGTIVANEESAVWLENISIINATVTASSGNAGGAVGQAVNGLNLRTVTVTGNDTTVTATNGNAGGLIGEFAGTSSGVHITIDSSYVGDKESKKITVKSDGTNAAAAGGLVGKIKNGYLYQFQNSYSTALVKGDTAGGLVGMIEECYTGSEIKSCYVGGHTVENTAKYATDADKCNIRGTTAAGGFIGTVGTNATMLSIQSSYSTASASGQIAGGFIGQTEGGNVSNCYAVGYVKDTNPESTAPGSRSGAFIGENKATINNSIYFELINKDLPAVGSGATSGVTAAETNLKTYNDFVQLGSEDEFSPYDALLGTMFGARYYLPTASELTGADPNAPATHVGDWQPVDTLVTNKPDGT